MIKFGSRTELIVPADSRIDVRQGDQVRGGQTVIGFLPAVNNDSVTDETDQRENAEL